MTKRNVFIILMLAASLSFGLMTSALAQTNEELRDEFHQTYPFAANGRVSLENINGSVHIVAWERNEVRVDAIKRAYRRDRLDEAKIEVEASPDVIRISTEYPDHDMTFNNDRDSRIDNPASVEYTLSVPRNARLDTIELINGALSIEGVAGDVVASSINGRVSATGLGGEAKLSTVNGKLEANFDRLDESKSISLTSVNGSLTLTIPSDANAQLKANTVHGNITNEFGLPVRRGEYVGQDLAGTLGKGGVRIKLGNVNGGITIRHAADGRTLSHATSLLAENSRDKIKDKDSDRNMDEGEAGREARRVAIEISRAQREAAREQLEAQREAQREQINAQREAQREALEAQREAQRELAENQRELERARSEIQREMSGNNVFGNSLRIVDRESKSFPVSGTPNIITKTFDGLIIIHAWDKPEVMYTAVKRAGSDQEMRGINLVATPNGSNISIVAEYDKSFARHTEYGTNINATVNLELYVPRKTFINAWTGDGRLHVEGVSGDLQLRTGDGSVDVRDCSGHLVLNTGDGRVRISNFNGEAEAKTGDGGITLDGRFAQLNARTGDGPISLAVPSDYNATIETDAEDVISDGMSIAEETPGGSARLRRWRIGQGGPVLKLHTGDGRIILRRTN